MYKNEHDANMNGFRSAGSIRYAQVNKKQGFSIVKLLKNLFCL